MDRIEGIPEGYRLGKLDEVKYADRAELRPTYITFELIPEQPKQLEAVIVVPIGIRGFVGLESAMRSKDDVWNEVIAKNFAYDYPDRVTIREREKGKE